MAALVTLAQAKAHLRLTTPPGDVDDPDVQLKLDAAEAFVRRYVGRSAAGQAVVDTWTTLETMDVDAQAAVLILLAEFWRFRGDDLAGQGPPRWMDQDAPPVVIGLLRRFGDPVIA
jgi:hypothetical protein